MRQNFLIQDGWLDKVKHLHSPFFTPRSNDDSISLLVIHNISLPAGQFGTPYISQLFLGNIDVKAHPSFMELAGVTVSAHCLIKRNGSIIQYVSFNNKAWHAGISCFNGIEQCNDFSIGIELEGTDELPYEDIQYLQLAKLAVNLQDTYPLITDKNIVGHCDIAPGRKTDPGHAFNWQYFHQKISQLKQSLSTKHH